MYIKMFSDLSQQLLRQVVKFRSVERPRLRQSGDDGASSLRQREYVNWELNTNTNTIFLCMVFSAFCSPSPLSAASSGCKPKSARLIPPDDGEKRTGNTSNQSKLKKDKYEA